MAKKSSRVIRSYLDDVADELLTVERLLVPSPVRFAVFHLQQAAEKLIKAVRLARGMYAGKEHNLESLIEEFEKTDEWRMRFRDLEPLSVFATAFRYPTPSGRRAPGPPTDVLWGYHRKIGELLSLAREELLED